MQSGVHCCELVQTRFKWGNISTVLKFFHILLWSGKRGSLPENENPSLTLSPCWRVTACFLLNPYCRGPIGAQTDLWAIPRHATFTMEMETQSKSILGGKFAWQQVKTIYIIGRSDIGSSLMTTSSLLNLASCYPPLPNLTVVIQSPFVPG
eukprot:SAG11_NODE_2632_length_3152_cov_1.729774_3_plen_151_part_00